MTQSQQRKRKPEKTKDPKDRQPYRLAKILLSLTLLTLLGLGGALVYYALPETAGEEASIGLFEGWAENREITSAVLKSHDNRILFMRDDEQYWVALPGENPVFASGFITTAIDQGIPLDIDQQAFKRRIDLIAGFVVTMILVCGLGLAIVLFRAGGGNNAFLKAAAKRGAEERPVTFADVAGVDEAILEIREVRDYLLDPARLEAIGAEAPHGVLLVGPPGTGKTLLARAVAGEAGVPFFAMSGTDFVEMYVGVGAARIRDLFRQVRERAPAILFIDELDALGRARGGAASSGGNDERDQTLNQLLVEIDGFASTTGVVIMGATNRPDVLDKALLRRGRFDRQIVVDRPDRAGRLDILRVHAANKRFEPAVDLDRVAVQTTGFTGADLASLTNEAALLAARRGKEAIGLLELEEAVDRVLVGSEGRVRRLSPADKRAVAYHEGGHALVAFARPEGDPVSRISIVSRGSSLGHTRIQPDDDKVVVAQNDMHHELAVSMGGRAAEDLVLGEPTSGPSSDLRRATRLARRMVCEFGMSDALGMVALGQPGSSAYLDDGSFIPDYSAEVAGLIDREIRRMIDEAYDHALQLLRAHRDILDWLVEELVANETLREDELQPFADAVAIAVSGMPAPPLNGTDARAAGGPAAPAGRPEGTGPTRR
ncbi:MAG: ATP-dependent zinc metalloprotease FtsH [Egibacteraceae bacterium]